MIAESRNEEFRREAKALLVKLPLLKKWDELRNAEGEGKRRAFIIEIDGMPKAGKSSTIEIVKHYFSHGRKIDVKTCSKDKWDLGGYNVHSPAEGVSLRTPGYLKEDLLHYNTWAGAYAIQQLIEARHDRYHDMVILDRGPWDAGCWLEYVETDPPEGVAREYIKKSQEFFQLPLWISQTDLHVVLTVAPTEAADRAVKSRLIEHLGPAGNPNIMEPMFKIYKARFKKLQTIKEQACSHVGRLAAMHVDTSEVEPIETAILVIKRVFDVLERKMGRKPELTFEEIWKALKPLRGKEGLSKVDQVKVKKYLRKDFVPRSNRLPAGQRVGLRQEIVELRPKMSLPQVKTEAGMPLFENPNRAKAEPVMDELEKLLRKNGV